MKLSEQIFRKPLYVAFGQALAGGGITSVDLVATRVAATVTMTASDGSAAPIAGADASTAGVMTAADKIRLDGFPTETGRNLPTIAALSTNSIDAAVNHVRTAGHSTAGDGGGALYKRVATEPTHNLKIQSADLAWWELVAEGGAINVLQAGADPTGVVDSILAFRDCADFARYNVAGEQGANANGPAIVVPQGKFFWSDTLEPRAAITMVGAKRGVVGNIGTIIEVATDKTGLLLPKHDTLGAGKETPNDPLTKGAGGSFVQGFQFKSLGGSDATKHGVHVRVAGVTLSHVEASGFPGDGFHILASSGTLPAGEFGNANHWHLDRCSATDNQVNGLLISGSDVNAGTNIGFDAQTNGRWGIWDESFLGNTHIGGHCQGNGSGVAADNAAQGVSSGVEHLGGRFHVMPGQEALASITTPGTDPDVWHEVIASGFVANTPFPAWLNGNTYVAGGAYYFEGGTKLGLG